MYYNNSSGICWQTGGDLHHSPSTIGLQRQSGALHAVTSNFQPDLFCRFIKQLYLYMHMCMKQPSRSALDAGLISLSLHRNVIFTPYKCILMIIIASPALSYSLLGISVGRYQYFTSGIRYYKFKIVFGTTRHFDQTQLTSYSWHFC